MLLAKRVINTTIAGEIEDLYLHSSHTSLLVLWSVLSATYTFIHVVYMYVGALHITSCTLFVFSTALPLTVGNVTAVFSRLRDLTRLSRTDVPWSLKIPRDRCHSAESAAQWWLEHGQERTWRQLIWTLDWMNETSVAYGILHCAEPPPG